MKVKCIERIASSLPEKIKSNYSIGDNEFSLKISKEYLVYALSEFYQNIWYCIFDEQSTFYPMWTPSQFFELNDNHLSRHWIFSLKKDVSNIKESSEDRRLFLGIPEWASELGFYDKLTEGEEREVAIFKAYKALMDLEFPDPSITEAAQIGDQEWLICPECMDAWSSSENRDGMVVCPKCNKIMHNPRYRGLN
jgi:hypothetical protein